MNAEVFDGEIGVAKLKGPIRDVLGSIREISSQVYYTLMHLVLGEG